MDINLTQTQTTISKYPFDILENMTKLNKKLRDQVEIYHKIISNSVKLTKNQEIYSLFSKILYEYSANKGSINEITSILTKNLYLIEEIYGLNIKINESLKKAHEKIESLTFEQNQLTEKLSLSETNLQQVKTKADEYEKRNKSLVELVHQHESMRNKSLYMKNLNNNIENILEIKGDCKEYKDYKYVQSNCRRCDENRLKKEELYDELKGLKVKIEEKERKFLSQIKKKDEIIDMLDKTLLEYENKINNNLLIK